MKLPIKIENGIASLIVNRSRKLTPRQQAQVALINTNFGEAQAQRYLETLIGLSKGHVSFRRLKTSGIDTLAGRPKNMVFDQLRELRNCDYNADHRPYNNSQGKWVGVEIECYIPHDGDFDDEYSENEAGSDAINDLRYKIKKAGITRASVKYDGSLHDDEGHGVEVTLLFNTTNGFEPLYNLCKVLNDNNCFVNKKAGLHVHLDARHLDRVGAKALSKRLGRSLPVLKWLVDASRHTNTYCKLSVSPFRRDGARYYAINSTAWHRYKTIEVRLHGGSTNASKIQNWIEVLQFLSVTPNTKRLTTFQDLLDLGLPDKLVDYAEKRIDSLHANDAWNIISPVSIDDQAAVEQITIEYFEFRSRLLSPLTPSEQITLAELYQRRNGGAS